MISYPASSTFISDEVSQDPVVVAAFARRHGLGGIELCSMFGRAFRELTAADIIEIARIMSDNGLRILGCATPVFKCPLGDETQLAEHENLFRRSVDVAAALNCSQLRVFTFLRKADRSADFDLQQAGDHVAALVEHCLPGMTIGVENEASCLMATGEEAGRFFVPLWSRRLNLLWDPCNVLYVPGYHGGATAGFSLVASRIGHIHMKDAAMSAGGLVACKMGEGEVDWPNHFKEISAAGYKGSLSLETHWRIQTLDRNALHLPSGYGFSAGGEFASEACLEVIQRML
jgi:sugar phosphate isomerase/epimerase